MEIGRRTRHPFHMYDAIFEQPEALVSFSYHLALARGTNPDSFRAEDPRFARADVSGRL